MPPLQRCWWRHVHWLVSQPRPREHQARMLLPHGRHTAVQLRHVPCRWLLPFRHLHHGRGLAASNWRLRRSLDIRDLPRRQSRRNLQECGWIFCSAERRQCLLSASGQVAEQLLHLGQLQPRLLLQHGYGDQVPCQRWHACCEEARDW